MYYLLIFKFLLIQLLLNCGQISAKVDLCFNNNNNIGIDLSELQWTTWSLTETKDNNERIDYSINICVPLNNSNDPKECRNSYICGHKKSPTKDEYLGYEPKSVEMELTSNVETAIVVFEGPVCDEDHNRNNTIRMRFTCGQHLEYPQHFIHSKCVTELFWRTYAVCKKKPIQTETKCYVYDNNGLRRDLTPLIQAKGGSYKVLNAQNQDFFINVCSNVSNYCKEPGSGACLKTDENKYISVGDFRYSNIEFKGKNGDIPYDHIEMTYKTKSRFACSNADANLTSVTTIRFICPQKGEKRSFDFVDRNPKLVSNLDCDYQIEWETDYACPVTDTHVSASKCELIEDIHGIDFNLKDLMKSKDFYKIESIQINGTKGVSNYDIYFNVCGGLGKDFECGNDKWDSKAVCLKSKSKDNVSKVIGQINSESHLKLVDNRFLLEYRTKDSQCHFGDNIISETTLIEFICDETKPFENKGKPEFILYNDCTYYIQWKTPLVCPVIRANTSCVTTYKDKDVELTFDLSSLRKSSDSESWSASVVKTLPWSRLAKDEKDDIFLNVCGVIPKKGKTKSCEGRSSACMTIGDTNTTINLGHFTSPPKYNEDIKSIELIYENGFDSRTNKNITSKITFRCKPGSFNSEPTLIDINEEIGVFYFEWETWAACPINSFTGTDCKVRDTFLDYTFDLNPLKAETPYFINAGKYHYYINVCGEVKNECSDTIGASGPIGACQNELEGNKRSFSLGKASTNISYWNGIINMTFINGTPYNNVGKTPRKSHIAFICDPNAGKGKPEFDGERDRSYFFRWYTSLACPHVPRTVHCVWENGSHVLNLSPLAMTSGNHFTIGLPSSQTNVPSIYYINICRPLNPIHEIHDLNLEKCGPDSAVCRILLDTNNTTYSLGKATNPPFQGFDGNIHMIYENGSICPSNKDKRIKTLIKFECDPHSDLSNPLVHEPDNEMTDHEECIYVFEFRTAAVCDVLKPTVIEGNSCIFTDNITKLSVDLSSLRRISNTPYKVGVRQNEGIYELNICGASNSGSPECSNSAVCYHSETGSKTAINYGLLNSSSFIYDGNDLRLRYSNGSKCSAHDDKRLMSSEIIFKCNPEAKQSEPTLQNSHSCVSVFELETNLVCNLKPQKCSIVSNNKFYNLRQLSSLSHSWITNDTEGNQYLLNVCTKLPPNQSCKSSTSASVCKCNLINNKYECSHHLGDPSEDELQVLSDGSLLLTYKNGEEENCANNLKAQTQINFKCAKKIGEPKFIQFVQQKCIYKFEWNTIFGCAVDYTNDVLIPEQNGFLHDARLDKYINIGPLLYHNYTIDEMRKNKENKTDEYTYVINLNSPALSTSANCSKAAVCQTKKGDPNFHRDIGTLGSIKYFLRGYELQIVLQSLTKKCGRNHNKNVTTIFRLQCSSRSDGPVFMYESDDCDYTFIWETSQVCVTSFMDKLQFETVMKEQTTIPSLGVQSDINNDKSSSGSRLWIGIVILVFFVLTLILLFTYKQRFRQSMMFRFRRLFGPETSNHTFHYHQLASNERERPKEEVVFISRNDAQNRNTIAAQPSGPVPYCSIYDDSDVDLLT